MRDLGRVEGRLERERLLLRILEAPLGSLPGLLQPTLGVEGLGPRHEGEVDLAAQDRLGRLVHELLRNGAADARVGALSRIDAQTVGQPLDGIVVLEALAIDDLGGVDRLAHPLLPDGRLAVGDRGAAHLFPHGEGLGRLRGG